MIKLTKIISHRYALILQLVAFCIGLIAGCENLTVTKIYQKGAVTTAAPIATDAGVKILKSGGNAFDAAIAIGFTLAVVHPEAGNIGGGGFAVIRDGITGEVKTLDFRETAPALANDSMYLDEIGEVIPNLSLVGAKAAGVPGTVAGLYELWKKNGSLPWEALVNPAASLADSGFIVDSGLAVSLNEHRNLLTRFPETSEIFVPNSRDIKSGDRLVQTDLAGTLYLISSEGPDGFYTEGNAEKIVAAMESHGGLISIEDLAGYRPVWRDPITFKFDRFQIYSMAPPSSGGIMIGQIMKLIESFDFSRYTVNSPEYIHLFTEASRLAFSDRYKHLGDPAYYEIPSAMLDNDYLANRQAMIDSLRATPSDEITFGQPLRPESEETTHFSVVDSSGNIVSITYTINSSFGSGLVIAGAGFLLNNEMDDFSIKPNVPNLYGLIGGEANKIESGKRMLSSMSPTIVMKDHQPRLVLGTPGGSKIITTVAQALINHIRFNMTPNELCQQPRFHHQWLPDLLYLEEGSFDITVIQELTTRGHQIKERDAYGDLNVIELTEGGDMIPSVDPRGRGVAAGY